MSLKDEIMKAIGAHGMWKTRIATAIETGKCEIPAEKAGKDDQCEFGKWLYGPTLSAQDKAIPDFTRVRELHKQFHAVTGRILQCAETGNKAQSKTLADGDFRNISAKLTSAMMEWKSKVQ